MTILKFLFPSSNNHWELQLYIIMLQRGYLLNETINYTGTCMKQDIYKMAKTKFFQKYGSLCYDYA